MLLVFSDSSDEACYVPVMEQAGYQRTKLELAARQWNYMQEYADAKSAVVEGIIARTARTAPQP